MHPEFFAITALPPQSFGAWDRNPNRLLTLLTQSVFSTNFFSCSKKSWTSQLPLRLSIQRAQLLNWASLGRVPSAAYGNLGPPIGRGFPFEDPPCRVCTVDVPCDAAAVPGGRSEHHPRSVLATQMADARQTSWHDPIQPDCSHVSIIYRNSRFFL